MARSTYDDFVIEGRLGSGSYGCVWRVTRKIDGLPYAMKEIDLLGLSRKEQEDCIKETRILSSLDSDNCIKYYDSFLERGKLFIIMEYAGGGNLHDFIKGSTTRLPEDIVWRIFIEMLLGLNHMHRKKILHRDVKTLNIFLTSTDPAKMNVKLGDMGVAKILSTQTNFAKTIVGTPYYLSPELCEDKPYNEKSDVWALGVVLYECCSKRHPFDADNQGALILKILRGKYPPLSGYSPELIEVVRMCLTLNAAKRPDTNMLIALPSVRARAAEQIIALPDVVVQRGVGSRPGTSSRPSTGVSRAAGSPTGLPPAKTGAKAGAAAPAAAAAAAAAPKTRQRHSPSPAKRTGLAVQDVDSRPTSRPPSAGPGKIVVSGDMFAPREINPIDPDDIAFKFGATIPSSQPVEARAQQHGGGSMPATLSDRVTKGHPGFAAWEDAPASELEELQIEDGAERQGEEDFVVDEELGEDGHGDDNALPAMIDVEAIKKTLVMLRGAAVGMIGSSAFEQLYDMIRSHSDHDNVASSDTTITELSNMVFKIITVEQADVIPLVYKVMFLEAQIEQAVAHPQS